MRTQPTLSFPRAQRIVRRPEGLDFGSWCEKESWAVLPPLTPLVNSGDGSRPRQSTTVRICYDDESLWVRFDCDDHDPWATLTNRDAPLWTEDVVEVFLAAGSSTPTVYYEFEINPLGALFDARVSSPRGCRDGMTVDVGWDCEGVAWGARKDVPGYWAAWLRIPRSSCGTEDPSASWRMNFYRIDGLRGSSPEYSAWLPTGAIPPDFHRPERFGFVILAGR